MHVNGLAIELQRLVSPLSNSLNRCRTKDWVPLQNVLNDVKTHPFGRRFAVSDVVVKGAVPAEISKNIELWVRCVAGSLRDDEYISRLMTAGFEEESIEATRVHEVEDVRQFFAAQGIDADSIASDVEGKFMSGFIRAKKPK